MNKIVILFFSLGILFPFTQVHSQDTLKSFRRNWSTELNFNPFNGSLSFNNASGQIKIRHFEPEGKAWRFAATLNYSTDNSKVKSVYGTNPYDYKYTKRISYIGINFGREKHFSSTRRLSPYIGWETGIGLKSSYAKVENSGTVTEIKGAIFDNDEGQNYKQVFSERGYWTLSGNLVTGFDFYMAEKFYFGYEMLWGLDFISYADVKINGSSTNTPSGSSSEPDVVENSWRFGPKLINGIRIGFVF